MSRRGFTLVELLMAMTVMGILGIALARMLVSDSRFVSRQGAMLDARQAARSALNLLDRDLRMVSDSGVVSATPDSVVLRVPYAFGVTCRNVSNDRIMSLLPTDSVAYASAVPAGFAWLDPTIGTYRVTDGATVASYTDPSPCAVDSIRVLTGGRLVAVTGLPPGKPSSPDSANVAYLYQKITYRFGPSSDLPGRRALWRKAGAAAAEEIAAPFDSTAQFQCLIGTQFSAVTCPPSGGVGVIRGIEVYLVGASASAPEGASAPETFPLVTRIPFLNRGM